MNNAMWLFEALPIWYFATIANPLGAGPLSAIPVVGTISLVAGLTLASMKGEPRFFLFLIPFSLSQFFGAIAGALRGQLPGYSSGPLISLFIVIQVLLAAYLIYTLVGARAAALPLAVFSLTYALHAAFVASMSFSNDWL
jgi:hypothetical protein